MVELVPSTWTNEFIRAETRKIMIEVGQVPVSMGRELPGFILNRLQYALLNECWRLVADDIVSAEDLDVVMKDGLGLRYAVCGPMEVIHLNAEGLKKYCETYGNTIFNVSTDFKGIPEAWKMDTPEGIAEVEKLHKQMTALYPMDKLDERRLRRDKILATIAKTKRQMNL
jgi:L-gulonate 3-dehydrogenase